MRAGARLCGVGAPLTSGLVRSSDDGPVKRPDSEDSKESEEPTEAPAPEPDRFERLVDRAVSVRKKLQDEGD